MMQALPPIPPEYRPPTGAYMPKADPGTTSPFIVTANGLFPWSAKDKLLHFATGIPGGAICFWAMNSLFHVQHPWWSTVAVGVMTGLAKEAYDMKKGGKFEFADAGNTALGFALGAATIRLIF